MTDIATRLRQTRANMLGTDDELHYWDCHDAAAEIERLRLQLREQGTAVRDNCVTGNQREMEYPARPTLTDEDREAVTQAIGWIESPNPEDQEMPDDYLPITNTLRKLLKRLS